MKNFPWPAILILCVCIIMGVWASEAWTKHKESLSPPPVGAGIDDGSTVACNDGRLHPVIDPTIGEVWCDYPSDPFAIDRFTIRAVKGGYYQYSPANPGYHSNNTYSTGLDSLCHKGLVKPDGTCTPLPPKVPTKEQLMAEEIDNCRKNGLPELATGDILDYMPDKNPFTDPIDRYIQITGVKNGYFVGKVYPGGELRSSQIYDLCVGLVYGTLKRRAPKEVKP